MSFQTDIEPLAAGLSAPAGWTLPEALHELPARTAAVLVGQLIEPFQTDTETRLERARRAIADADTAALRAEVHSLKGSASQMGDNATASVCAEMESAIGHVPISQLLESVGRLEFHATAAVHAMRVYSGAGGDPI